MKYGWNFGKDLIIVCIQILKLPLAQRAVFSLAYNGQFAFITKFHCFCPLFVIDFICCNRNINSHIGQCTKKVFLDFRTDK